jgi:hypothetical protein
LQNLFIGLGIEDADRKRALLLHYAGERVYDIYDAEKKESEATFEATKKVLKTTLAPKGMFKWKSTNSVVINN